MKVAASLVAALLSSGCVGGLAIFGESAPVSFLVPDLAPGMSWTTRTVSTSSDKEGEFTVTTETMTRVLERPTVVLDAYGNGVECVPLETRARYEGVPERLSKVYKDFESQVSVSCIETASGTWLVQGVLKLSTTQRSGSGGFPPLSQPWSVERRANVSIPLYPEVAMHYREGTLTGVRLEVGGHHEWVRTTNASTATYRTRTTWDVTREIPAEEREGRWATTGPVLELRRTEAFYTWEDGRFEEVGNATVILWMAEGVRVPVYSVTVPHKATVKPREVLLIRYAAGQGPIGVQDDSPRARYNGTNPAGTFRPFEGQPNFAGLALEYPLADAIKWFNTDPRSAQAVAWLTSHPAAYMNEAFYTRDVRNGTYGWDLRWVEGREGAFAHVEKRMTPVGTAMEEASGGRMSYGGRGASFPSPESIRKVALVDAKTSFELGSKFLAGSNAWTVFSFHMWPEFRGTTDTGRNYTIPARISFRLGESGSVAYEPTPVHRVESSWWGPTRDVDARNGRLISGTSWGGGISSGIGLPI